jgi:hypothetical protein
VIWKDKQDVHVLVNMLRLPAEGSFCDEHGKGLKPVTVEGYIWPMGLINKWDRMANSYSASQRTWKWTKINYFLPLE